MNLKFECLQEILCDGFIFFISSLDLFGKISPSCLLLVGNGRLNDRPLDFDPRDSLDGISFKNGGDLPKVFHFDDTYSSLDSKTVDVYGCSMSHFHRFSSSSKKSWIIQSDI